MIGTLLVSRAERCDASASASPARADVSDCQPAHSELDDHQSRTGVEPTLLLRDEEAGVLRAQTRYTPACAAKQASQLASPSRSTRARGPHRRFAGSTVDSEVSGSDLRASRYPPSRAAPRSRYWLWTHTDNRARTNGLRLVEAEQGGNDMAAKGTKRQ